MVFKEMGMNGEERTIVAGTPRKRWTAARKQEVVLRLIRGETLEAVSRDVGVPMYRLADGRTGRGWASRRRCMRAPGTGGKRR